MKKFWQWFVGLFRGKSVGEDVENLPKISEYFIKCPECGQENFSGQSHCNCGRDLSGVNKSERLVPDEFGLGPAEEQFFNAAQQPVAPELPQVAPIVRPDIYGRAAPKITVQGLVAVPDDGNKRTMEMAQLSANPQPPMKTTGVPVHAKTTEECAPRTVQQETDEWVIVEEIIAGVVSQLITPLIQRVRALERSVDRDQAETAKLTLLLGNVNNYLPGLVRDASMKKFAEAVLSRFKNLEEMQVITLMEELKKLKEEMGKIVLAVERKGNEVSDDCLGELTALRRELQFPKSPEQPAVSVIAELGEVQGFSRSPARPTSAPLQPEDTSVKSECAGEASPKQSNWLMWLLLLAFLVLSAMALDKAGWLPEFFLNLEKLDGLEVWLPY